MAEKTKGATGKIRIEQVRSRSGRPLKHRRTLEALGLKRHQQSVIHDDTPAIRGMINRVSHLIRVTEVDE